MIREEIYELLQSPDEDVRLRALMDIDPPTGSDEITRFVDMLADKSWRVRKAAVQLLARTDVNRIVPMLVKALSIGHIGMQNVRFHNSAIECLTVIGQPAIPALTQALQNDDKNGRIAAATVLGAIRHHDACDALIQALEDEHINVRYAAVEALSKIPSQQSVTPLTRILEHGEDWLKLPAISALGHIGDFRATPFLINMAEQPLYQQTAVEALGNIGDEKGIPCIIEALSSPDKEIRKTAVMAMDTISKKLDKFHYIIQRPSTYQPLFRSACTEQIMHNIIQIMEERDYNLVLAAIRLLGWSGRQEAAYALLEKIGQEQFVEVVCSSIIHIGDDAVTPLAHAYTNARSLERKILLVECLREINGERVLQLFLEYMQQDEEELLTYALLKAFSVDPFLSLILADKAGGAGHYFERVRRHTEQQLEASHPLTRAEAVFLWGHLGGEAVVDDILNATKDVDPTVRVKAIMHLGCFAQKNSELLEHLSVLLSDDHPGIRKQAALALGKVEQPEVFPSLLLVLDDANPTVRRAAVTGVGEFLSHSYQETYRQQVLDKLADILENRCRRYEDGLLKIEICQTLKRIPCEESQQLLLQLAHDVDFDVRKSALLALGAFTTCTAHFIPTLREFLNDPHWSVREAAVTALGMLGSRDVEEELLAMLDDPDLAVRKALLIALGKIGADKAIPVLVERLASDELEYAAYQGLTHLVSEYRERIADYLSHKNPKVNVFIQHVLEDEKEK